MRTSSLPTLAAVAGAFAGLTSVRAASPLGTAFSYQGQVKLNDAPVSDTCDFEFTLWDDPVAGSQIGPTLIFDGQGLNPAPVQVENGLFNVELDFGDGAFEGDARWLGIATACPSGGALVPLLPRQPLNPAPYALWARNAWDVLGNAGTSPASNFVGTTDRSELVLATNSQERMRLMLNGQIGVGTSGPTARMHLLAGLAEPSLAAQRSGQPNPDLLVNGSGQVVVGPSGGVLAKLAVSSAAGEDAMRVRTDGVTRFFIGQDGQVGVGTSIPAARLQVNPNTGEDAFAVEAASGTETDLAVDAGGHVIVGSTGGTLAKLTVDSGAGEEAMRVRTEGVTRLFVGSDGQVGVGTSVPAARLQVNAATGEEALAVDASGGTGTDLTVDSSGRVIVGATGGALAKLTVDSAAGEDAFRVRVDGTTRFIVEDGGNVGVGTSVPAAKFQVDPAANQQSMVV